MTIYSTRVIHVFMSRGWDHTLCGFSDHALFANRPYTVNFFHTGRAAQQYNTSHFCLLHSFICIHVLTLNYTFWSKRFYLHFAGKLNKVCNYYIILSFILCKSVKHAFLFYIKTFFSLFLKHLARTTKKPKLVLPYTYPSTYLHTRLDNKLYTLWFDILSSLIYPLHLLIRAACPVRLSGRCVLQKKKVWPNFSLFLLYKYFVSSFSFIFYQLVLWS